jgi:hypothetical protein
MLGVGLMTVVLGGGLLAFRTLTSDGGEPTDISALIPTTPPVSSTAVLSAAPSATAVPQQPAAQNQPSAPAPTVEATIDPAPAPTEAPATAVSLPNRNSCDAIRGTPYRSETERIFFESNCQTLATAGFTPTSVPVARVPAASAPPANVPPAIGSDVPAQPVATTPPATSVPPTSVPPTSVPTAASNPVRDRLVSLTTSLTSASGSLAASVDSPNFSDAGWLQRARAAAQQVENLTGAISAVDPPACLRNAFTSLRAAASELSTANGFISSGLDAADASLLQTGAARLASGRSSLSAVAPGIASAPC